MDFQLDQKLQDSGFFFKIFKIPSNVQLVYIGLKPDQIFFQKKNFQQILSLEPSKVLAEMGCDWQASCATAKILMSIRQNHLMNKCRKFQIDIIISI